MELSYEEVGAGPPAVLIHGFGGNKKTWKAIGPLLSDELRLFAVDLKGFGDSPKPSDGRYSPSEQASLVQHFIETHGLHPVVLVGHSLGGLVAATLAARWSEEAPERVEGLILISSAGYPQRMPLFVRLLRTPGINRAILKGVPVPWLVRAGLIRASANRSVVKRERVEDYSRPLRSREAHHAIVQTAKQIDAGGADRVLSRFHRIRVPTLLIWGKEDRIVPLARGEQLSREISGSRLVALEDCGHLPPEERPEETADAIRAFLRGRISEASRRSKAMATRDI